MGDRYSDPDTVASVLMRAYGDRAEWEGSPVWLQWSDHPAEGVRHVVVPGTSGLLGQVVGPEWWGAAVVATGRLRLLDPAHEPPASLVAGFGGGVVLACTVSRDAEVGWCMRLPDGSRPGQAPEEGFVLDILRRALDLPTSPPPESTAPLDMVLWIGGMEMQVESTGRPLEWPEALLLHPAVTVGACRLRDPEQLEELLVSGGPPAGWEAVRRTVASGIETPCTPPPDLTAWMDAGMFARETISVLPRPIQLLPVAKRLLRPAAYKRMVHLVGRLERNELHR